MCEDAKMMTLFETPGAPELYADGAVIVTGGRMARLVLFALRFLDHEGERRRQVVGRVAMPLDGWRCSIEGATIPPGSDKPPDRLH